MSLFLTDSSGMYRPFFYPECLEDEELLPKPKWVRLWKIHGSICWVLEKEAADRRISGTNPVRLAN